MDFITAILTGFFTGIGVATANFLHEKHIRKKLDAIEEVVKKIKDLRL